MMLKSFRDTFVLARKASTAPFWNAGCAKWSLKPPELNVTPTSVSSPGDVLSGRKVVAPVLTMYGEEEGKSDR